MTFQEIFRSSDKGNYGHSWTNDRNSFPLFEEITKLPEIRSTKLLKVNVTFDK